jgi:single stranded DNA-binding protein
VINNVTLVGRLTKDPELKYTPNGVAVANFTLAVNRSFKSEKDLLGPFFFVKIFLKSRNIFVDKRICTMIHLVHTKDIRK